MPKIFDDVKPSIPTSPSVANPIGPSGVRGKVTGVTRIGSRAGLIAILSIGAIVVAIFYGVSSSSSHPHAAVASATPQALATDAPLIDGIPGAVPSATPPGARNINPRAVNVSRVPAEAASQPVQLPQQQPQAQPVAPAAAGGAAQTAFQTAQTAAGAMAQGAFQAQPSATDIKAQQRAAAEQAKQMRRQQLAEVDRTAKQSAILIGATTASNQQNQQGQQVASAGARTSPATPYVVQEGSIIPATLVTGLNSDLPGTMIALVNQDVYDSQSGHYLLIPAGSKLLGRFESQVNAGQSRVNVAWQRIVYPDGSSIDITGAEGADAAGYSGLTGKVDKHVNVLNTVLGSIISIGAAIASQPRVVIAAPATGTAVVMQPTVGQQVQTQAAQQVQQNVSQITGANGQQRPTIEVRPGYIFNVVVVHDLVLTAPYRS